ncbi:hypothetical protein [Dishui Lake large algae virus 1]|nr:hypothetical protein [Dishui Lake large algae virus 1]
MCGVHMIIKLCVKNRIMSGTSNRVIVFANPEDATRVAVMYPTGELPVEELLRRHVDTSKPHLILDSSELPNEDDDFFEAWGIVEDKVVADVSKARELHRKRLRDARIPLLAALDVKFMRAVESGDAAAQASIAAEKQKLRDLPADPRIDAAGTCAELRALSVEAMSSS